MQPRPKSSRRLNSCKQLNFPLVELKASAIETSPVFFSWTFQAFFSGCQLFFQSRRRLPPRSPPRPFLRSSPPPPHFARVFFGGVVERPMNSFVASAYCRQPLSHTVGLNPITWRTASKSFLLPTRVSLRYLRFFFDISVCP